MLHFAPILPLLCVHAMHWEIVCLACPVRNAASAFECEPRFGQTTTAGKWGRMVTPMTSFLLAVQEHLDLVRSDFQYVFKDIMDLDHFEEQMYFSDPISKFTFFRGVLHPHSCQYD